MLEEEGMMMMVVVAAAVDVGESSNSVPMLLPQDACLSKGAQSKAS